MRGDDVIARDGFVWIGFDVTRPKVEQDRKHDARADHYSSFASCTSCTYRIKLHSSLQLYSGKCMCILLHTDRLLSYCVVPRVCGLIHTVHAHSVNALT